MADSSPDSRTPGPPASRRPSSSVGDTSPPALTRASVPPSEPRSASRGSFSQLDIGAADRPARLQMIVALVLGLVLVAIPLYLWRRPRADAVAVTGAADAVIPTTSGAPPLGAPAVEEKVATADLKVLLCQDPGSRKTSPEQCDHLADLEKAFVKAVEDTGSCMAKDAGGGTVVYVADVSFKHKALNVATPKEGRTLKNTKAISACQSAVKGRLQALPLEPMAHAHARYKIALTATYPGAVK